MAVTVTDVNVDIDQESRQCILHTDRSHRNKWRRMFYLNARPACSTHKVAVDALEDLPWGHHLIKTHLNPEIRRKNFRSPDTPAH